MIKIELTFNSVAEAVAFLGKADGTNPPIVRDLPSGTVRPKAEPAPAPVAEKPKAEKPAPVKSEDPIVEKPKAGPAPAPAAPAVTYKDVQAAVLALTQIGANEPEDKQVGRIAARAVAKQLGLETFKGSPEGCWGTAIELLNAARVKLQG